MGQLAKTFRLSRIPLYLQVAATLATPHSPSSPR